MKISNIYLSILAIVQANFDPFLWVVSLLFEDQLILCCAVKARCKINIENWTYLLRPRHIQSKSISSSNETNSLLHIWLKHFLVICFSNPVKSIAYNWSHDLKEVQEQDSGNRWLPSLFIKNFRYSNDAKMLMPIPSQRANIADILRIG